MYRNASEKLTRFHTRYMLRSNRFHAVFFKVFIFVFLRISPSDIRNLRPRRLGLGSTCLSYAYVILILFVITRFQFFDVNGFAFFFFFLSNAFFANPTRGVPKLSERRRYKGQGKSVQLLPRGFSLHLQIYITSRVLFNSALIRSGDLQINKSDIEIRLLAPLPIHVSRESRNIIIVYRIDFR